MSLLFNTKFVYFISNRYQLYIFIYVSKKKKGKLQYSIYKDQSCDVGVDTMNGKLYCFEAAISKHYWNLMGRCFDYKCFHRTLKA